MADSYPNDCPGFTIKELVEDLFEPFKANVDVWQLFVKNLSFALVSMHSICKDNEERVLLNHLRMVLTSLKFSCSVKLDGVTKSSGSINDSFGSLPNNLFNSTDSYCDCQSKLNAIKTIDDEIGVLTAEKSKLYSGFMASTSKKMSHDTFDPSILAEASRIDVKPSTDDINVKKMKIETLKPQNREDDVDCITKVDTIQDEFSSGYFYTGSEKVSCFTTNQYDIITGCCNGSVFINLDFLNLNSKIALPGHGNSVTSISVYNNHAVTTSLDCDIQFINLETLESVKKINLNHHVITTSEMHGVVYAGCSNGNLYRINLRAMSLIKTPMSVTEDFLDMKVVLFDGKEVLMLLYATNLTVRQCATGSILVSYSLPGTALCIEMNYDSSCYYLGLEHSIYAFQPKKNRLVPEVVSHGAKIIKYFYGNIFMVSHKNQFFIYSNKMEELFSYSRQHFTGNVLDIVSLDQKLVAVTDANYYYVIDVPNLIAKLKN